ncbi:mucosa-associated lymphoid tissue lymphoma translocation protein 1-like [Lampetra fluviatilis]
MAARAGAGGRLVILVQPQSLSVFAGHDVELLCVAEGCGELHYTWFHGQVQVANANQALLEIPHVDPRHEGYYTCRVNNSGGECVFSEWTRITVIHPPRDGVEVPFPRLGHLELVEQPAECTELAVGDTLILEVSAIGTPCPAYQWLHNEEALPGSTKRSLMVDGVKKEHEGRYRCRISNPLGHEVLSNCARVNVYPTPAMTMTTATAAAGKEGAFPEAMKATLVQTDHDVPIETLHMPDRCCPNCGGRPESPMREIFNAVDKVALLIGNMKYEAQVQLNAPKMDVHELAGRLHQLSFKVVSLVDGTQMEMMRAVEEFLHLLGEGVYGLLYFAGHGYENLGECFMVPVDAPREYGAQHCLQVGTILSAMQERLTGLNVLLLDMCRKRNKNDTSIPQPTNFKVTANIVYGYATCEGADAYELNYTRDNQSHGIFVKYFKERMMEPRKVTHVLGLVAEDMGKCDMIRDKQAMEVRHSMREARCLTDPILPTGHTSEFSLRSHRWALAHKLPKSRVLNMGRGFKVQLGFAAEFSNVLIVYVTVQEMEHGTEWVEASVKDFSQELCGVKLANQVSLLESGCSLLSCYTFPVGECRYTRLGGLQKLKVPLAFTVSVQYKMRGHGMRELSERIELGFPLISYLYQRDALDRQCAAVAAAAPPVPTDPARVQTVFSLGSIPDGRSGDRASARPPPRRHPAPAVNGYGPPARASADASTDSSTGAGAAAVAAHPHGQRHLPFLADQSYDFLHGAWSENGFGMDVPDRFVQYVTGGGGGVPEEDEEADDDTLKAIQLSLLHM